MKVLRQIQNLLITAGFGVLLFFSAGRVYASVEGLVREECDPFNADGDAVKHFEVVRRSNA